MKALPFLVVIGIVLSAVCYAQHCSNPNARRPEIGGNSINGWTDLQHKPLKAAKVRLLSNGKTVWVGSTDDVGSFHIKSLRPGIYRLAVKGWGSTTIRIKPDLDKPFEQRPYYSLLLKENECIFTVLVWN